MLILGSMDEFVDLVKLAKSQNIYTVVCDGYEHGPAKQFADIAYTIDVRNTDEIVELCESERVDGIITSFSDLLAECMVDIADKAGLPCYAKPESFRYLRDKSLMKQMFKDLGINTPLSSAVHRGSIESDLSGIGFPCVVKPVNGYGSHGVYLLDSADEVSAYFDEVASYSSCDYILAERYCRGHEFNMMNWIVDGEVATMSLADRETSTHVAHAIPHVSRIVYPSRLIGCVLDDARDIVKRVADYIGIKNGPLSMQFFYSDEEGLQVCETAGRLFGYEHELVSLACGLSIEELLLDQVYDFDSLKATLKDHHPFHPACSAGLYFHGYEREIADVSAALAAAREPHVVDMSLYYQPGETIGREVGNKPYVVRYYLESENLETIDSITQRLFDTVRILDPGGNNLLYSNQMTLY